MLLNITTKGKNITTVTIKEKQQQKQKAKEEPVKTDTQPSRELRAQTLKNASNEGIYTAAKTGTVTNYIAPLAIHLGFSYFVIILLTAIPQLLGAISQLFVEKLAHFFKNRYKVLILTGYLEAYTWLPITVIAALTINNPLLLIILVTLDAIFMNMQSPIWNATLGDVIPEGSVAKYFGRRNIFVGTSGLISTVLAGLLLSKLTNINAALGFATLFFLGFLFARLAVHYQEKIHDPKPKTTKPDSYSFYQFIKSVKKNNFGTFTMFLALYKLAVAISTPFFAIYMLRELNFSYLTFTLIISGAVLSSVFLTNHWTKIAYHQGSKKVLKITALLIPLIPILWILSTNWKILLIIELISGALWAGFNISASTFIFEAVNPKQKVKFMAYNNVLAGIGAFIGTMIGLLISYSNLAIVGSIFITIFLVSGLLRLVVATTFINKIQEEKVVEINLKEKTYKRFITIRPKEGVIFEIIGRTKQNTKKEKKQETKKEKNKVLNLPSKGPFKDKPKYKGK